jgi:predicted transcriptional regulator
MITRYYVQKCTTNQQKQLVEFQQPVSSVVGEFKVKEVEKKVSTLTCVSGSCSSIKEGDTIVSAK